MSELPITVAITGASGSVYGLRLIEVLLQQSRQVQLIISDVAYKVLSIETDLRVNPNDRLSQRQEALEQYWPKAKGLLTLLDNANLAASCASGSFRTAGMVIVPASMGSVGRIAHGISTDLISRAADVCLKERYPLLLVPRETPLNSIHLENMLTLSRAGAHIIPAMPGFYHRPETINELIDQLVGKVLDAMNIEHQLFKRWGVTQPT